MSIVHTTHFFREVISTYTPPLIYELCFLHLFTSTQYCILYCHPYLALDVQWYPILVFIFIFLMVNEVERVFLCLSAIWIILLGCAFSHLLPIILLGRLSFFFFLGSFLVFSKRGYYQICLPTHFSHVQLFVTPWTVGCQAPLSMGFSRQEQWNGLPFPSLLLDICIINNLSYSVVCLYILLMLNVV